jgi:hypothetical protein
MEERIFAAIKELKDDLKQEIHLHFATKTDLAEWKLEAHDRVDTALVKHCKERHHRRLTGKGLAALLGALAALTVAVTALAQLL